MATSLDILEPHFLHLAPFGVLVCRACKYAVVPAHIRTHLKEHHRSLSSSTRRLLAQAVDGHSTIARDAAAVVYPPPTTPPFAVLPLTLNGLRCLSRDSSGDQCTYVCRSIKRMQQHHKRTHQWINPTQRGRPRHQRQLQNTENYNTLCTSCACQRFFEYGQWHRYFQVTPRPTSPARSSAPVSTIGQTVADSIWQTLDAQDATREAHLQTHHSVCQHGPDLSPWLEMTQWPRYLNGQRLSEVAPLAHPAQPVHEPLLHLLVESLDRIVEQAHREICDDRINVFDQTRINCFLPRPRAFDRPIMVKLQKATYRRYVSIWKRLLCFIYRTVVLDPSISLPHQLTSAQGVAFDRLLQRGREVLAYPEPDPSPSSDPLPSPTRSPQERGAFSPDGKQIASASDDTTVRVWDVERGGVLHTLEGHSNGIAAVAFSPDGKQIASASDDTTVRVWDVERGGVLHTLEGHSDRVTAVAFSPDGKQIASASDDTTVRVWDVERGGVLHTLEGHLDYVIAVAFSPDGKQIASASGDKTVRVWNAEKGSLVDTLSTGVPVSTVMFSADGSHLEIDLGTLSSPCLASYSHQKASTRSPKLFVQERWVFIQGRKVLWLPPKYVITCIAVHGSIVVMGHASGRVIIMEFGIGLMEQDD